MRGRSINLAGIVGETRNAGEPGTRPFRGRRLVRAVAVLGGIVVYGLGWVAQCIKLDKALLVGHLVGLVLEDRRLKPWMHVWGRCLGCLHTGGVVRLGVVEHVHEQVERQDFAFVHCAGFYPLHVVKRPNGYLARL